MLTQVSNDEDNELVMAVADDEIDDVGRIAGRRRRHGGLGPDVALPSAPRSQPLPAAAVSGQGWAAGPSRSDAAAPLRRPRRQAR